MARAAATTSRILRLCLIRFRLQVLGRKRIGQSLEIGLIVAAALAKTTASPIVVLWQGDAHHGGRA